MDQFQLSISVLAAHLTSMEELKCKFAKKKKKKKASIHNKNLYWMIRGQAWLRLIAVAFQELFWLCWVCLPLRIDLSTSRSSKTLHGPKGEAHPPRARTHNPTSMFIPDDKMDAASLNYPCINNSRRRTCRPLWRRCNHGCRNWNWAAHLCNCSSGEGEKKIKK